MIQSQLGAPIALGCVLLVSLVEMHGEDEPGLSVVVSLKPTHEETEERGIAIGHGHPRVRLGALGPVEACARDPERITELAASEQSCVRSDPLDFLSPLSACVDRNVAPDTGGPTRFDRANLFGTQPDL